MSVNFILNGQANGDVASRLLSTGFDPGALRPMLDKEGRSVLELSTGVYDEDGKVIRQNQIIQNATATLTKDAWKTLDLAIVNAAKPRLTAISMMRAAGLTYNIPEGMGKTVLEVEALSDISPATVNMDGIAEGASDRPHVSLTGLPLPIISKDFQFSARQVLASREGRAPLDTTNAELAGRRVAEEAEKMFLGVSTVSDLFAYAGYTIYGLTDFTSRNTKTMTAPDGTDAGNKLVITELLAMRTQLQEDFHYGPFFCFVSNSWDDYLDGDYSSSYPGLTLRDRIGRTKGIDEPVTLDYLPTNTMILIQKTSDVARIVEGMDITTVQWESHGGMQLNYKVMAIIVPQIRADFNSNCGIVHGSHA